MIHQLSAALRSAAPAALLVLSLCAAPSQLHATAYTVNTLTDAAATTGGNGSGTSGDLRYCLTRANSGADAGPYTLSFSPGLTGKITLGSHELVIKCDITITGPGEASITVDGNSVSRILYIAPGHAVSISGLTMGKGTGIGNDSGGVDPGGPSFDHCGGAILNDRSTLTLDHCTFTGNVPPNFTALAGAGVYNRARGANAALTVTNCTFTGNSATDSNAGGGAIENFAFGGIGTLTVSDSTISNNITDGDGGGILNYGLGDHSPANATVTRCTISGNSAGGFEGGGGICSTGDSSGGYASITVNDTVVSGNSATRSNNSGGGGILNGSGAFAASDMVLSNCTISGNSSNKTGGGVHNDGRLNVAKLTVNNCTVSGNTAITTGGGITNFATQSTATLKVNNSTIARNTATQRGGGIFNNDPDTSAASSSSAATTIANSTICGNSAVSGGAGLANDKGQGGLSVATVTVTNTILALNSPGANCNTTFGTFTSGGFNLSDDASGSSFLTATGDRSSLAAGLKVDGQGKPLLADNGGATQTVALLAGSAAIDAGKAANDFTTGQPVTEDQRGLSRPVDTAGVTNAANGDGSDIGAYESGNGPTISVSALPGTDGSVNGGGKYDFGADVTVIAAANAGHVFVNWTEGGTQVSTSSSYTFRATTDRTLVANFRNSNPAAIVVKGPTGTPLTSGTGTVDFGSVATGQSSAVSMTIQNSGELDLTLNSLTFTGANPADFKVTTNPGSPIAGGSNTTFTVTFKPVATGPSDATLKITSDATNTPLFQIKLAGVGLKPATIAVKVTGGAPLASGSGPVDFGLSPTGSQSLLSFTVQNLGEVNLTLGTITFTTANSAEFGVTTNPVAIVTPGGSTAFTVRFTPGALGDRGATLHLPSTDPATQTFDIILKGKGVPPVSSFKGTYQGLSAALSSSDPLNGTITATLEASRTLSVKLKLGGRSYSLRGVMDALGKFTAAIPGTAYQLNLTLDLEDANGRLTGILKAGNTTVADLGADRAVTGFTTKNPSPLAGRYTITLPADPNHPEATYPQGRGYGFMTISATGVSRVTGLLGDLTSLSVGGAVSTKERLRIFQALSSSKGSISGWLTCNRTPMASNVTGTLDWTKPTTTSGNYPAAFSGKITVDGSVYLAPASGDKILDVPSGKLKFTIGGGNVTVTPAIKDLTINAQNKIRITTSEKFTLTVTTTSGYFTGTFYDSGNKARTFKGAVLQSQNFGGGLFKGNGPTGTVQLDVVP